MNPSIQPPPRPPPPSFFWFVTFLRVTSALSTSWTARTADRCDHPPSLSRFRASDVLPPPSSSIVNLRSLSTSRGALTQMVAVLQPLGYSNCEGAARILGLWDPTRKTTWACRLPQKKRGWASRPHQNNSHGDEGYYTGY